MGPFIKQMMRCHWCDESPSCTTKFDIRTRGHRTTTNNQKDQKAETRVRLCLPVSAFWSLYVVYFHNCRQNAADRGRRCAAAAADNGGTCCMPALCHLGHCIVFNFRTRLPAVLCRYPRFSTVREKSQINCKLPCCFVVSLIWHFGGFYIYMHMLCVKLAENTYWGRQVHGSRRCWDDLPQI